MFVLVCIPSQKKKEKKRQTQHPKSKGIGPVGHISDPFFLFGGTTSRIGGILKGPFDPYLGFVRSLRWGIASPFVYYSIDLTFSHPPLSFSFHSVMRLSPVLTARTLPLRLQLALQATASKTGSVILVQSPGKGY
jgi:hypothetical protein